MRVSGSTHHYHFSQAAFSSQHLQHSSQEKSAKGIQQTAPKTALAPPASTSFIEAKKPLSTSSIKAPNLSSIPSYGILV